MSDSAFTDKPRNFRGTKDFSGDDARWRLYVTDTIRRGFESFGFEPLETPMIETDKTLAGKYGDEGEKKRFRLALKYPEAGGLRYDHTVPLARFIAMNPSRFPMPYRRYAIGPVFRNETVQAGRLRQFVQCDFDTVGSTSPIIDAEIVAINYIILSQLGFGNTYRIRINDRRLLNAMAQALGFNSPSLALALFRAWDKLEKVDIDQVVRELGTAGASQTQLDSFITTTSTLLSFVDLRADRMLAKLNQIFPTANRAIADMSNLTNFITAMGVPNDKFALWPLLARGLDYYTGPIFETVVETSGIGSITGGGRFDQLVEQMGGPNLPASGSSFGLERVMGVMEQLGLKPASSQSTQVFVTVFNPSDANLCQTTFDVARRLRLDGFNVEVYTGEAQKLGKQFEIANKKRIPLVILIGPDEQRQNTVTVKVMDTSEQYTVPSNQIITKIRQLLSQ